MKNTILYIAVFVVALVVSCTNRTTTADVFEGMEVSIIGGNTLLADSISSGMIEVTFDKNLIKNQKVTITTSNGLLFRPPYNPDSNGVSSLSLAPFDDVAKALLRVNTIDPKETVFISATINDFTKTIKTSFLSALPDDMQLSISSQQLTAADSNAEITGQLYRNAGLPSNGIRFEVRSELELVDTSQVELRWNLPEFVFSSNKQVKVPLAILQHSKGSQLRIFISTKGANEALLEKSMLIWLE